MQRRRWLFRFADPPYGRPVSRPQVTPGMIVPHGCVLRDGHDRKTPETFDPPSGRRRSFCYGAARTQ